MQIRSIKIEQFKNYPTAELHFGAEINCLTGPNGAGKTNILDAIYYLCTGKSYFNAQDAQLIFGETGFFSLKGDFLQKEITETVLCVQIKGRRKVIKRNDEPYARLTDHYGAFPVVMIAPGDIELISGGSEERRKWMDSVISWMDHDYLIALLKYDKILQQRNAELRNGGDGQPSEEMLRLLKVYDEMMIPVAERIYASRKIFMEAFIPFFSDFQRQISGRHETSTLQFISAMHDTRLADLLSASLKKDMVLQRTNAGPHKDDLEFLIEGNSLKKFGSQGQQKTFLLALKLAQHRFLQSQMQIKPILLLDDVCERLDEHRLSILFRLIRDREQFGQVFVTDTSEERILEFLDFHSLTKMFNVLEGNIIEK